MATKNARVPGQTQSDYAQTVADAIIKQLKEGTAPWQKPWTGNERRMPYNPTSGKDYRGGNAMYLWAIGAMQGFNDTRWMTYRQAEAQGAQVRKGEKGTRIQYVMTGEAQLLKDDNGKPVLDADGQPQKVFVQYERPRTMHFTVFNASQIDGLPPASPRPTVPEWERIERAEAILSASGASIGHEDGNRAFYRPSTDTITLPIRERFPTADGYYATALHELGHWTGHPTRLNRDLAHPFGSEGYAKEELRAEISSLMLGDRLGIGHDPGQHAAYVESWIKVLENDPREILRASSDAEKITTYVLGLEHTRSQVIGDARQPDPAVGLFLQPQQVTRDAFQQVATVEALENHGRRWKVQYGEWHAFSDAATPELAKLDVHEGAVNNALYNNSTESEDLGFHIPVPPAIVLADYPEIAARYQLRPAVTAPVVQSSEAAMTTSPDRTILAVPFKEKDQAKAAGARWDKDAKVWYAPAGADLDKLGAWLPTNRPIVREQKLSPQDEFADALRGAGLLLDQGQWLKAQRFGDHDPLMDGNRYRVKVEGDTGNERSGMYIGFTDGHPAGHIQNFRTGTKENWKYSGTTSGLNDEERARQRAEAAERLVARNAAQEAEYAATAAACERELDGLEFAPQDHPYLVAKGLSDEPTMLRVDKAGNLVVPIYRWNDQTEQTELATLQRIAPDGEKRMQAGGRLAGCFYEVIPVAAVREMGPGPIIICEGWATGESVGRAVPNARIVDAFNAGNLEAVAKIMRERYPDAPIIIAGDNDHAKAAKRAAEGKPYTNPGAEKAKDAAGLVNGHAAIPTFKEHEKGSDWNDVANSQGNELVKQAMLEAQAIAVRRMIADANYTGHDATRAAETATLVQSQAQAEAVNANAATVAQAPTNTPTQPRTVTLATNLEQARDQAEEVADDEQQRSQEQAQRQGRSRGGRAR
jgi:antirestriction protein ArdC/phage/plasmid primase-like uncharacterized protein